MRRPERSLSSLAPRGLGPAGVQAAHDQGGIEWELMQAAESQSSSVEAAATAAHHGPITGAQLTAIAQGTLLRAGFTMGTSGWWEAPVAPAAAGTQGSDSTGREVGAEGEEDTEGQQGTGGGAGGEGPEGKDGKEGADEDARWADPHAWYDAAVDP